MTFAFIFLVQFVFLFTSLAALNDIYSLSAWFLQRNVLRFQLSHYRYKSIPLLIAITLQYLDAVVLCHIFQASSTRWLITLKIIVRPRTGRLEPWKCFLEKKWTSYLDRSVLQV